MIAGYTKFTFCKGAGFIENNGADPAGISKAVRLRINKPFFAETEVEIATTNGTASPSACGHEITITVTILSSANSNSRPRKSQVARVVNPPPKAI